MFAQNSVTASFSVDLCTFLLDMYPPSVVVYQDRIFCSESTSIVSGRLILILRPLLGKSLSNIFDHL